MDADCRRRTQREIPESARDAETVFLRRAAAELLGGDRLADRNGARSGRAGRPALVREIHALDANVAPSELITMREQVDRTTAAATDFGHDPGRVRRPCGRAGCDRTLRRDGVHGVAKLARAGVADGARRWASDLLRLVLTEGLALTAGGVALGLVAALQLTRLLGYLLYTVSPRDPLAFGSAFVVITVASLVACMVPAWRATRTDRLGRYADDGGATLSHDCSRLPQVTFPSASATLPLRRPLHVQPGANLPSLFHAFCPGFVNLVGPPCDSAHSGF